MRAIVKTGVPTNKARTSEREDGYKTVSLRSTILVEILPVQSSWTKSLVMSQKKYFFYAAVEVVV